MLIDCPNPSNQSPRRFWDSQGRQTNKCVQDFAQGGRIYVQGFVQGSINVAKALHKDAKMRPFCKDAKMRQFKMDAKMRPFCLDAKLASKRHKNASSASRWIRTPLYLSTHTLKVIFFFRRPPLT